MKRLLLLGGGHAQLSVLESLAEQPLAGWDVQLVTPYRRLLYSGMLPGWVAGHYPLQAFALPLDALANRARVGFRETTGIALDLARNEVICADGSREHFDVLSIDTGPQPAIHDLPGAAEYALPLRPIEGFVAAWPAIADRARMRNDRFDIVIVGAGAGGVEIAFAIRWRSMVEGWSSVRITLVGREALPLENMAIGVRRGTARLLQKRNIEWLGPRDAQQIREDTVEFSQGTAVRFDACVVVTGAAAAQWPAASGLATDERGFIRVSSTLQSVSHPHIFAAGDAASLADPRLKSGVYAVRAGLVLARNLRAICEQHALRSWTPQRRALYLLSTGDRHAIAIWGQLNVSGRWVWRWKDWIDRRFAQRYGATALQPPDSEGKLP
ncbi:MAG: FAD-dependent oxidoreductase [Betaproteobacteria bacterium]